MPGRFARVRYGLLFAFVAAFLAFVLSTAVSAGPAFADRYDDRYDDHRRGSYPPPLSGESPSARTTGSRQAARAPEPLRQRHLPGV